MNRFIAALICLIGISACSEDNTGSYVDSPGEDTKAKTKVLESGAKLLQDRQPLDAMSAYLDGFHFYNGDMDGQMEAHHYFTVLNEDLLQAVIYDGNTKDAKIMGVEYVISERLFKTLPAEEKALWHSHKYEVKSGLLVAPGIPALAETELMKKIVSTYGKTWHTWHTDRDKELPYGVPALMMGFTEDGQIDERIVTERDQRFGINTGDIKKRRAEIPETAVADGADAWKAGKIMQVQRVEGLGEHAKGAHSSDHREGGAEVMQKGQEHQPAGDEK
jgi:hypothetical protein